MRKVADLVLVYSSEKSDRVKSLCTLAFLEEVGFSEEEGFVFRTGQLLHLSPDAHYKQSPHGSAAFDGGRHFAP